MLNDPSYQWLSWAPWGVAIAASLVAAATDLRTRRIPNLLTGPVFVAGLVWATATHGLAGAGESLLASLLLAGPFVLLFLFAGGGAADAKMMGAVGAWIGLANCTPVLLSVLACGVIVAVGYTLARGQVQPVLSNLFAIVIGLISLMCGQRNLRQTREALPEPVRMLSIPYGVAIFSGVCIAGVWCIGARQLIGGRA